MNKEELVEEGIVLTANDGKAEIMVIDSDSCEECSAKIYCKPSSENKKTLLVKDPFGVKPGDKVKVALQGANLFKASGILYGIPLLILIAGILVGVNIFENSSNKEVYAFLLSVSACALYYFVVYDFLFFLQNYIFVYHQHKHILFHLFSKILIDFFLYDSVFLAKTSPIFQPLVLL